MSKRKLLINEVFDQAKKESGKTSKSGLALYLKVHLESFKIFFDEKTFSRYYDAFVLGIKKEINLDTDTLNKLSQYVGYDSFKEYIPTFEKKIETEEENTTSIKFLLDGEEVSVPEKIFNIIIKITNNPNFNVPDFMKKNGLGVLEFVFVAMLVTGGVVFSNPSSNKNTLGLMSFMSPSQKYMYWNGEQFIETDSNNIGPEFDVIAKDEYKFKYLKKITRKDTMTVENSLGRTWYSKYNGDVEFFTSDGVDPGNRRELRKSTSLIIKKYAGKKADSIQAAKQLPSQ
ncbi:hypothetical protein [Chryseobacterium sp. JK1]|uniref:hypothetical protein n=1 Tax=Chryseobacterium sp. JK1 TaxID=874294 RepID=UPI003D684E89